MADVLGYSGKVCVITGAASGMGAAATELLLQLGAEVHALDIGDVKAPVKQAIHTNMMDKASIDAAIDQLPAEIDVLFNCAGVPSPPTAAIDTVLINFVGLRHLTDALLPRIREGGAIASISSTAGMGWKANLDNVKAFLELDSFDAAAAWLKEGDNCPPDGYGFSKQALIVYTQMLAGPLAKREIRINCISPSPTDSNFMTELTKTIPKEAISGFAPAHGRFAPPEEMGKALVMLGSDLASFVSGVNLPVDYGYCGEVAMGQRDNPMNIQ